MKKTLFLMTIAILFGGMSGIFLFSKYSETSIVFNENRKLYFLEEGVYSTKKTLDSNTKNIKPKLVIEEDGKYHLYVGITGNKKNASKLKSMYKSDGYSVYEKELIVSNVEFISNIDQFDILLDSATNKRDILSIEEVILSNYENLVK